MQNQEIFRQPGSEMDLLKEIMVTLSARGHHVFRANVGTARTVDGRYFKTGLPKGFSDLFGTVKENGQAFFVEVKYGGNTASFVQENFLSQMSKAGCRAGLAYSVDDALKIVEGPQVPYLGQDVSDPIKEQTRDGELWNQLLMWASLKDEKLFSTLRKMRANGCTLETDDKTGYKIVHPDSYTSYDEDRKGLLACARELTHRLLTLRWSAAGAE